jgi:hypothetical protein
LTLQKNRHNFTKLAFKPLQTNLFNIVLVSFFPNNGMCQFIFSGYIKKKTAITPKKQVDTSSLAINKDKSSISAKRNLDTS